MNNRTLLPPTRSDGITRRLGFLIQDLTDTETVTDFLYEVFHRLGGVTKERDTSLLTILSFRL